MDKNDIVDIIIEKLNSTAVDASPVLAERKNPMASQKSTKSFKTGFFAKQKYITSYTSLTAGRPFISEYELKELLKKNSAEITVPKNAIISPLALEIIAEKNIKVSYV